MQNPGVVVQGRAARIILLLGPGLVNFFRRDHTWVCDGRIGCAAAPGAQAQQRRLIEAWPRGPRARQEFPP